MGRIRGDRLEWARMPKKFDGSGVVDIQCSTSVYKEMKLDKMPPPRDYGQVIDGVRYVTMRLSGMGADAVRYRVMWPETANGEDSSFRSPSGKPPKNRTSSFVLSRAHNNETLYVLAEWLRSQSVQFIALTNKHGNAFKPVGLSGSSLAYLTGDIPETFSTDIDLLHKPLKEDV